VLIENSQGFKNFELFKSFIRKLIQTFYLFLEELLWEKPRIKILFSFNYSNLCKLAYIGLINKGVVCAKDFIFKTKFESYFKHYFIKYLFPNSKKVYLSNPNSYFMYACKSPLLGIIKFYWKFPFILKTSFINGLEHCVEYYNNLEICLIWFESNLQNIWNNS
jgi:hypothetical protein